jgi:hypothetical protein
MDDIINRFNHVEVSNSKNFFTDLQLQREKKKIRFNLINEKSSFFSKISHMSYLTTKIGIGVLCTAIKRKCHSVQYIFIGGKINEVFDVTL